MNSNPIGKRCFSNVDDVSYYNEELTSVEKCRLYMLPYNKILSTFEHMAFDDEKHPLQQDDELAIKNKWRYLHKFLFQLDEEKFRDILYDIHNELYRLSSEDGKEQKEFLDPKNIIRVPRKPKRRLKSIIILSFCYETCVTILFQNRYLFNFGLGLLLILVL